MEFFISPPGTQAEIAMLSRPTFLVVVQRNQVPSSCSGQMLRFNRRSKPFQVFISRLFPVKNENS